MWGGLIPDEGRKEIGELPHEHFIQMCTLLQKFYLMVMPAEVRIFLLGTGVLFSSTCSLRLTCTIDGARIGTCNGSQVRMHTNTMSTLF